MKLTLRHAHQLDPAALRRRIDERLAHYDRRHPHLKIGQHYQWLDEASARAAYRGGSARITLGGHEVAVELDLPFFARIYRHKIEEFVRRELDAVTRPT